MISTENAIARLDRLRICRRNVAVIEHSTCAIVYASLTDALADRLRIDGEVVLVEAENNAAVVVVLAPSWAIRAAGLDDRALPVVEIKFRHCDDARAFMGDR